jgi:hypothetical protein
VFIGGGTGEQRSTLPIAAAAVALRQKQQVPAVKSIPIRNKEALNRIQLRTHRYWPKADVERSRSRCLLLTLSGHPSKLTSPRMPTKAVAVHSPFRLVGDRLMRSGRLWQQR